MRTVNNNNKPSNFEYIFHSTQSKPAFKKMARVALCACVLMCTVVESNAGNLVDVLNGEWVVRRWSVGSATATEKDAEPAAVVMERGMLLMNSTETDGMLQGELVTEERVIVKVEAPRVRKAAVLTFTRHDEDVAFLQITLKPQPFPTSSVSLSKYTTPRGSGTAAAVFHTTSSLYISLIPTEGASQVSQSYWLTRPEPEPTAWDNWRMGF